MRVVALAVLVASSFPASAQVRMAAAGPVPYYSNYEYQMMYHHDLKKLREDILRQQRADGGTLQAANAARFQARLDKLNAGYRRNVQNNDPLSVDATGGSVKR